MDYSIKSDKKLIESCVCDYNCNTKRFIQNFNNWTSGNNDIDKFIQNTQLSEHTYKVKNALEWIPYDRLDDIKYVADYEFGKVYSAKWTDGCINKWDASITLEFINKIAISHKVYGITQDQETKNYMVVLKDICEKCKIMCNSMYFQQNFNNWTSGNNDINKFIQNTQLSEHTYYKVKNALEWIPYDRLYDIEYITDDDKFGKVYRANWADGCIWYWNKINKNWKRKDQNMFVILKILNNSASITLELINKIAVSHKVYGITQDQETKNYMVVLKDICEKCKIMCNSIYFQRDFNNWTSGNNDIDEFIQNTQISEHDDIKRALEWIPYNKLYNIKYIADDKSGKMYKARWTDGCISDNSWNSSSWDDENQNWEREDQHMFVILKILNNPASITLELFINKIAVSHKVYGITQDSKTENYMVVLKDICEKCKIMCNSMYFQRNFNNWTSGNNDIDKFIQNTQLSEHTYKVKNALEWIPYDRLYDIKYITDDDKFGKVYSANWTDGCINGANQNWKRKDRNMSVILKILNNPASITLEFINKIAISHKVYGITQDPKTENYMVVFKDICGKCDKVCNSMYFQRNFNNWTSGNNDIDKFIQYTQLSAHDDIKRALEWIPYNKLFNIKYIADCEFGKVYSAKWTNGYINEWDDENQNWKRKDQNMFVILKILKNPASITLEFINKIAVPYKVYGITQDPKTKNYMVVLNYICEKCNEVCNSMYFQQNFSDWTSGNNDIDKFIQNSQLSAHDDIKRALEWIPYNKLYNIKYIADDKFGKMYGASWTDGCISDNSWNNSWDNENQNWKRRDQNMFVILKILNNPTSITPEFIDKIAIPHEGYGITQDPETKNYIGIFNDKYGKYVHNAMCFQQNFNNWTSGNNDIDKFIQDAQKSYTNNVLEWIPYDRFYDIKYIAKGGFGKVYRAKWIDGYIDKWDDYDQNWKRKDQNMVVALKSLNNSKNVTLEFMNEITLHYKVNSYKCIIKLYGITQDPKEKNYIMVLDYAEHGNLRNYLDIKYNYLNWNNKISYLHKIAHGLRDIHEKELIHRDLHIGNILRLKNHTCITDMGLCKPADYNAPENAKNKLYGILPYIAPEILRGQNYTKAADIYSFGIIMYEVISGLPPYYDVGHDINLAVKICKGFRPRFNIKVPQLIVHLIKKCLDANPLNRLKAEEIERTLSQWFRESFDPGSNKYAEINNQIKEAEMINKKSPINSTNSLGISYKTHSEAIYTSRLLNFSNLPEPKNSDDYYEENDNIISMKFSGIY
ncbi:kinase-like domain-containing protein [Rhizophagus irregularis DAOM 181602=DAOM 197198]|nr:kinase-like domain-containing protein [Rhizophagus irregularis DAOM 181602=DAOM 197198]